MEQPFDAAGPLRQAREAMREFGQEVDQVVGKLDRLQGERQVRVAMVGQEGGVLPPGTARWSEAPDPNRFRRMILPGDTAAENQAQGFTGDAMGQRALDYWDKINAGGAYHSLRHAGDFALKGWDSYLPTQEKEQHGEYLKLAASRPGQEYAAAMEGMEKAGHKIAGFLAEIAKGGDAADKAKGPLSEAREELEKMSGKGERALSSMPAGATKESLAAEALKMHQEAASGVKRSPSEEAAENPFGGLSGRQLLGWMRNPQGAAMGAAEGGLASLLQGGLAAGGGAGLAAVGGAAVGGLLYGGYKVADRMAGDAMDDSVRARQDVMLGRQGGFDFRGAYRDQDRNRARPGVDSLSAREVWGGMNDTVSMAGWSDEERRQFSGGIVSRAPAMGMENRQLASWMGTAFRTGAVERDPQKAEQYENRIQNLLQAGLEAGVASKETLSAIAQLNARQVDQLGAMSGASSKFTDGAIGILNATGDRSLQGTQGAKVLGAMGATKNETQMAMLLRAGGGEGALDSILGQTVDPKDKGMLGEMSTMDKVALLNKSDTAKQMLVINALKSGAFEGMPSTMLSGMIGVDIDPMRMAKIQSLVKKGNLSNEEIMKQVGSMENAPLSGQTKGESNDISKFVDLMKVQSELDDHNKTQANKQFAESVQKFNVAASKLSDAVSGNIVAAMTGKDSQGNALTESERLIRSPLAPTMYGQHLGEMLYDKWKKPKAKG